MNKDANYEIVSNTEKISYLDFITRLIEINRDCNHEHYLSEVFIPFFSNVLFWKFEIDECWHNFKEQWEVADFLQKKSWQ